MTRDIDFVVNCYERTYRAVLEPGYIEALALSQCHAFTSVTVLVNNVHDVEHASKLAARLLDSKAGVTRVEFVRDHITQALLVTGLRDRDIRRLRHFTDCCLVAANLPGPEWFVYWDADARLRQSVDWIGPCLERMSVDPGIAIGNPNNWHNGLAEAEALHLVGEFAFGFGMSDVAFLARRSDLAAPIYRKLAPAAWRYPLAHVEPVFEQRVDAWMRRTGLKRLTYLPAVVTHPPTAGENYPVPGLRERVRRRAFKSVLNLTERASHPALRPWP